MSGLTICFHLQNAQTDTPKHGLPFDKSMVYVVLSEVIDVTAVEDKKMDNCRVYIPSLY